MLPMNRVLGRRLVPGCIRAGFSANLVTLLSLVSGVLGGWWFACGTRAMWVAGALAFTGANVLDETDGALARQTGTTSEGGKLFDTIADTVVHVALFLGVGVGMARHAAHGPWILLACAAVAGSLLSLVLDLSGILPWQPPANPVELGSFAWVTEWLRVDFSWLVVASAMAGQMGWIVWAGALGVFLVWIPSTAWITLRARR